MSSIQIPADGSSAVMITDKHGTIRYMNEFGQLHREDDLPAIIELNGTMTYYQHGLKHRDGDKPAYISSSQQCYYQLDSLHRDGDKPALIHLIDNKIVSQAYYQHGLLHRNKGPAMSWDTGSYQYYQHGVLHNDNGPACHYVRENGTQDDYYLNGKAMSVVGFKMATLRRNLFSEKNDNHAKWDY
jgi:hypothetical protein